MRARAVWRTWTLLGLALGSASACGDVGLESGDDLADRPERQPPTCPDADEACENQCNDSTACGGGSCVANFDPDQGGIGVFECRQMCIELGDDAHWCTDSSSCCDPGAECSARGYCLLGDDATGESTTGGTATDGSSDASTGSGSDAGTDTDTDTDTDADSSSTGSSSSSDGGTTTTGA